MRNVRLLLLVGSALWSSPAFSAEALKYGAPPSWVVQQPIPVAKTSDAPVAILLNDQQIAFDQGKITTYSELAFRIQNPQGLQAGNLSIIWQPSTDTVTVNKLQIRRGDKVIDVLGSGQTFNVLRRETNLEAAMLDGTLTANILPEDLREGDVIAFATTIERSDPVMKGHVEASFAAWNGIPLQAGHVLLSWPAGLKMNVRESAELPPFQRSTRGGRSIAEISASGIEPLVAPKNVPVRYKIGRLAEASDFASWAELSRLVSPLFRAAAVIPASGPLREELEKIRSASNDPKTRTIQALALVEDRVRYVALLMGQGGYVPASAEQTWSRRFGDCKAKTALLLGLLHELGVEAEPVLVNSEIGDALSERLPMLGLFDHVLVRAHIAGRDYWLDGTRTGDTSLDDVPLPDFGWVLPLVDNPVLVHAVPPPFARPDHERHVDVDASGGIFAPAPTRITEIYRGDSAVGLNILYSTASAEQRDQVLRESAKAFFDSFEFGSSALQFDKSKRELTLVTRGRAKLAWDDGGWLYVPTSSIAFDPDFDRPAGALHDVPVEIGHPSFVRDIATIKLPRGFFPAQHKLPEAVHETLAGVEYTRTETVRDDILTVDSSERTLMTEIPYKDAVSAKARLKALSDDDVYLRIPVNYHPGAADIAAKMAEQPASADDYFRRGRLFMDAGKYKEAIADFTAALEAKPRDEWSLANRGISHVMLQDFTSAEKDLVAAEAIDPGNPVAMRARGLMAEHEGQYAKAVDWYTRSLTRDGGNSFALGHRAIAEAALSKNEEALADSAKALKDSPTWIDIRLLRANIFMRQGKHDLVAVEAEAMTRDNQDSDYAWVGAAKTYAALGERDKATKALDRALAIKPQAYIYVNRSAVRSESDISGRIADLDAALKLEPDSEDALQTKAELLSDQGDYKGALALLGRIKTDPPDFDTQQERAIFLFKAGQTADAERLFQSVRGLAKTAKQLNALCWNKATKGILLDSALQDCRDALKLNPDAGSYLDSLGMVLLKLGKLDEALDAYNQAVAKSTGAASLMGRAFVYLRKGDRAHAEADAAAARKIYSDIDAIFARYGLKFDGASGKIASETR